MAKNPVTGEQGNYVAYNSTSVIQELEARIILLNRVIEDKQATIDSLMLEYCPDQMTEDQLEVWYSTQQ
jgi:hypothetical protein